MTRVLAAAAILAALFTYPEWAASIEGARYWETILRDMLVFAIYALSLDILIGRAGMPSLGHAAFFGGGAYAAAVASSRLGTDELVVVLLAAVAVAAALVWWIGRSHYGRSLAGVRENERRMRALGYDTTRLKLSAFVLAAGIAAVAGALSAWSFRFVSPNDVGLGRSVEGFVMVLIGGAGSIVGPILGAAVVLYIDRVLSSSIPYSQTVLGLVFIAFVIAARQGIVGVARGAYSRVRP